MVSIVGAQEVRPEGSSSRTSVLQALIGTQIHNSKAQKPRKIRIFRGFLMLIFIKYD